MKECKEDGLIIKVRAKKKPRFKAGTELGNSVNSIMVDVDQEICEDSETILLEMKISSEVCPSSK
jgi:hypothetical protein